MRVPEIKDYPKELHIGGDTYKIVFAKNIGFSGDCDQGKHRIRIKAGMSKNETFRTFLHEALHAIEFSIPVKIKHKTVYKLEEAIFNLLVDNFFS